MDTQSKRPLSAGNVDLLAQELIEAQRAEASARELRVSIEEEIYTLIGYPPSADGRVFRDGYRYRLTATVLPAPPVYVTVESIVNH